MDLEVVWSPESVEDLESIAQFIARDSAFYAGAVVERIIATARSLPQFPRLGRIVPEIEEESLRERLIYNFRLIYRIREESILVVAVIHGKQLLRVVEDRF